MLAAACAPARPAADAPYDLVIADARIVDGTGNPWYEGDVGVRGDRIATVAPKGALAMAPATTRVDHVRENMGAAYDRLPDASMRSRMIAHVERL